MNNTMVFSCDSEIPPIVPLKLKVEINCREHFSSFKLATLPFKVESRWFSGECELTTYNLEELLDSKPRWVNLRPQFIFSKDVAMNVSS